MNEDVLYFKCKDCGSEALYFDYEYDLIENIVHTLECSCEEEQEFAARNTVCVTTSCFERMLLDDEHRPQTIDGREEIERIEDEGDLEVQCYNCLNDSSDEDWTVEIEHSDIDEEIDECYVRCAGCEREIEFGWSHPERGGRIWPVECSDFNPWKSWPEPRYREKWLERGWIRPDFR